MRNKNKYYIIGLVLILLFAYPSYLFAVEVPTTITVGLESVYREANQVELQSVAPMTVGYLYQDTFQSIGDLSDSNITIRRAAGSYYAYPMVYSTLQEAERGALSYIDAVPVYLGPNEYKIYTTMGESTTTSVGSLDSTIAVYNSRGNLILMGENTLSPLYFQGYDPSFTFPTTGVGKTKKYRGIVGVVKGTSGLTPINRMKMEEYLYGVVPAEMVATWPIEALKAQAVAARSLATFQYNRYIQKGYNIVDTTATQVYSGATKEQSSTNLAVDATQGEVATYNGKIAETVYFSTSGGYTEDPKNVWGNEVPYLKAIADTYETEPESGEWRRTITLGEVDACLRKQQVSIGQAVGIEILSRTKSGRVSELRIIGSSGEYIVKNENTRTFFNASQEGSLKSRMYSFSPVQSGGTSQAAELALLSATGTTVSTEKIVYALGSDGITTPITMMSISGVVEKTDQILGAVDGNNTIQEEKHAIYGDFTLYGKGFGHGVGMSQSGAKGLAKAGYTYQEILDYYYQDIQLER